MATQTLIRAQVQWVAVRSPTSSRWLAESPSMGFAMEGDTLDELSSLIDEAMELLLTDLAKDGELDTFLRERGWGAAEAPLPPDGRSVDFAVPWQMIVQAGRDSARSAH